MMGPYQKAALLTLRLCALGYLLFQLPNVFLLIKTAGQSSQFFIWILFRIVPAVVVYILSPRLARMVVRGIES